MSSATGSSAAAAMHWVEMDSQGWSRCRWPPDPPAGLLWGGFEGLPGGDELLWNGFCEPPEGELGGLLAGEGLDCCCGWGLGEKSGALDGEGLPLPAAGWPEALAAPCGGPEKACTDGPAAACPVICDVMLVGTPTGEPCRERQQAGVSTSVRFRSAIAGMLNPTVIRISSERVRSLCTGHLGLQSSMRSWPPMRQGPSPAATAYRRSRKAHRRLDIAGVVNLELHAGLQLAGSCHLNGAVDNHL